jgi:chromosome partitioning protein
MRKIIPLLNTKGGVGRTTTAVNLAAGLARRGRRVLLVDLDSQGSASTSLGIDHDDPIPSSAEVLFGTQAISEAIRPTARNRLDLLPGSIELANADVRLPGQKHSFKRLRRALADVEDRYQTVIVDCASSLSILSINALVAADAFLLPVCPSYLAVEGIANLSAAMTRVREGIGRAPPMMGVILTRVTRDEDVPPIIEKIRSHYGDRVFTQEIREDPKLREAPACSQDIFQYAPNSTASADYDALVDEIEERLQAPGSVGTMY